MAEREMFSSQVRMLPGASRPHNSSAGPAILLIIIANFSFHIGLRQKKRKQEADSVRCGLVIFVVKIHLFESVNLL
jgi:hypothetical protein